MAGWNRDPSRDGVPQYVAQFVDGMPSTLYSPRAGVRVTLRFQPLPLHRIGRVPAGHRLFLVPYALQCAFLQAQRGAATEVSRPRIAAKIVTPSLDQLLFAAYRREEYAPDGRRLSKPPSSLTERRSSWKRTLTATARSIIGCGTKRRAVRGDDFLIGNGIFTVAETWNGEKLVPPSSTPTTMERSEYREVYGAQPMKLWDYDEDGRIDSREYPGANGTVIREFATSRNGVFDLRIVWSGARIVQVRRGGSALPVSEDRSRGVTWIGQPRRRGCIPMHPSATACSSWVDANISCSTMRESLTPRL